ncbi:reverse transcriptase [Gossypium australe]|uniref:Reverse transcriptase n=1 Tax=Gossypium australe TaxID=47621 RepID=A0A5B6UBG3_9ROSI|nr:reverse transcriptase [Gossypium australe]
MLAMRGAPPDDIGDTFGEGFSPPKVEFFIWKLLHGRIPTKLKLLKKGITSLSSTICALCLDEKESVHHLFVRVGSLKEFDKTGVLRGISILSCLRILVGCLVCGSMRSEPVWNMSFFAIAWTIWLHLNDVVFNGKLCDLDQFYDLTVVRIGWWYAEWPGSVASTYEFLLCSPSFSPPCKPNMNISNCQWRPTPSGCLKFNVDGAISGQSGDAVIRGIIREDKEHWDIGYFASAESLANKEACLIFCASSWVPNFSLIIESDYNNAISWHPKHDSSLPKTILMY